MEAAIAYASKDQYAAAIKELRASLVVEPEDSKALFLLARCQAGMNQVGEAIETLGLIPEEDPDFGIAAIGQRAEYLSGLGRFNESIPLWRQLTNRMPSLDPARSSLAIDLYRVGRRVEAARELQVLATRGTASQDELRRLLNATDPPPSRAELIMRSRRGETPREETGLPAAWSAIKARNYRDALERLESIPMPRSTQADVLIAWLHGELAQFEQAQAVLRDLPESSQTFPSYWLAVGAIHESEARFEKAAAAFERAMSLDPTRESTHDRLAAILLRLGKLRPARAIDERRFALAGPAEAILAIGPGQPDDEAACESIVNDLVRLGRFDQAAAWLEKLAPRHPTRLGNAGTVAERVKELRSIDAETRRQLWSGGLSLGELPEPDIQWRDLPRAQPPSDSQGVADGRAKIRFRSAAKPQGIDFRYRNAEQPKPRVLRLFEQIGGGVIAFDYDRDGDADLYFAQAGCEPGEKSTFGNQLFRNDGESFVNVTSSFILEDRYSHGVAYGDWNQDGFWDIAIGNFGANQLLINQGDGTFLDRSDLIADNKALMTASLAMADLDGDGLSDWIEVNYVDDPAVFDPIPVTAAGYPSLFVGPNKFRAATDRVGFTTTIGTTQLRNLADPSQGVADLRNADAATDATAGAEIPRIGDAAQPGLGLMVTNLDSGPGLECFIANDSRPNQCWRVTPGDRRPVQDIAMLLGLATSGTGESTACMGIAAADFNRDGFDDLAVTNWYDEWTNLYEQNSGGSFADRSPRYGLDRLSDRHVGFGMAAEDFDGDGWVDLLVGNGHVDDFSHQGIPQKMPTQVLQNIDARFEETRQSDAYFSVGHVSRSVVTADVNRDGKMDVVLTDLLDDAELLINETEAANWIQFQLVGTTSERSATGARVIIEGLPNEPTRTLAATAGYMGRGEDVLHFGLAGWTKPVSVRVQWPDGTSESYRGLAVNQRHLLTQGQSNGSGR